MFPKSCKPCRDLRRQNSNSHVISQLNLQLSTNVGAANINLTLAIEDFGLNIDPDYDTAMADYASRFFKWMLLMAGVHVFVFVFVFVFQSIQCFPVTSDFGCYSQLVTRNSSRVSTLHQYTAKTDLG